MGEFLKGFAGGYIMGYVAVFAIAMYFISKFFEMVGEFLAMVIKGVEYACGSMTGIIAAVTLLYLIREFFSLRALLPKGE
jgi:hypothetical protein